MSTTTLDPSLYNPSGTEVAFFKAATGIESDEALKEHVLEVQREAWEVVPYKCILVFSFMRLAIAQHPKYEEFLKLGKERSGAIFVEFACCFGSDVRKAIADGYPIENVVASDLNKTFWELGHKLFKSTPTSFPVPFIQADAFDPTHIVPRVPFSTSSPPSTPRPSLPSLTSFAELQGHVSALHTASFFHLFSEEDQLRAARALATLLSPEPGSMLFGHHIGFPVAGLSSRVNSRGIRVFCHSPESWKEMWDGMVFEKGQVEVWATLHEFKSKSILDALNFEESEMHILIWSVKRV